MIQSFYIPLVLFCFATSISPGPANLLVMASAAKYGFKKALPVFWGILVGFNVMVFLVGVGLGELFRLHPTWHEIIQYIGVIYMLYLTFCIIRSDTPIQSDQPSIPSVGFIQAALLQWVNPKAWVMAIGVMATYAIPNADPLWQSLLIAFIFLLVGIPCIGTWLVAGIFVRQFLSSKRQMQMFNLTTGLLLFISILFVLAT